MLSALIMIAVVVVIGVGVAWRYNNTHRRDFDEVSRWDSARAVTTSWADSGRQPPGRLPGPAGAPMADERSQRLSRGDDAL